MRKKLAAFILIIMISLPAYCIGFGYHVFKVRTDPSFSIGSWELPISTLYQFNFPVPDLVKGSATSFSFRLDNGLDYRKLRQDPETGAPINPLNHPYPIDYMVLYDEFNFAVKALQSGAVDFLVKPVDDETLIESLRKSIERLDEEKMKEAKISRIEDYLRISSSSLALSDEDANSVLVKQVCSYIESNYDKRIGLDEIAADCSYSKFHMARIFKSVMNMTVIDYLTKVRMEKAKELLAITKDSVKVIAFRTGYSDPNYFSLTFRKYEGITPLQYRAKALSAKR